MTSSSNGAIDAKVEGAEDMNPQPNSTAITTPASSLAELTTPTLQRWQPDQNPVSPAAQRAATIEGIQARMARTNLHQAEVDRQYKDELRWLQKEVDHLKAELDVSRRRRTEADEEIAGLKALLQTASKEVAAAQVEAAEARARAEAARKDGSRAEVERLRNDLEAARKTAHQAGLDLAEAQRAAATAIKELRAIQAESAARDAKVEAAEAKTQSATTAMESLQEQVSQLSTSQQEVAAELTQTRVELWTAQGKMELMAREIGQARSEAEAQGSALVAVQQRLVAALAGQAAAEVAEVEAAKRAVAALAELGELKQSVSSAAALKAKLATVESELSDLQSQYRSMIFEHAKSRAEHAEMSGKMTKAQEETARYMSYNEEVISALRQQLVALDVEPVAVPEPPPLPSLVRHHSQSASWGGSVAAILASAGLNSNRRISLGNRQNSGGSLISDA